MTRMSGENAGRLHALLRALRPHQWVKNLLVFVPAITGHILQQPGTLAATIPMFVAFCATASGTYILNDLLDLETDRKHPRRRRRPFASGALPLGFGWIGPALIFTGIAVAGSISLPAAGVLLLYAAIATSYSAWLKTQPLIDVFALTALYLVRILGGGVATDVRVSIWLLGFSSFLFLSLACLKRVTELDGVEAERDRRVDRRGYVPADRVTLQMMGVAFASALVLSLYVDSTIASELYRTPEVLWLMVPLLLFWECRLWLAVGRGKMHDDPVLFATRDWVSWLVVACSGAVYVVASGSFS
jgi:4-hydroxybenzoate polyprenyltransferase